MSNRFSFSKKNFTVIASGLAIASTLVVVGGINAATVATKKPVGCYSYVGNKSKPVGKKSVPCTKIVVKSMTPNKFDRKGGTMVTVQGTSLNHISRITVGSVRVGFGKSKNGKTITFKAPKLPKPKKGKLSAKPIATHVLFEEVGPKGKVLVKISLKATYK